MNPVHNPFAPGAGSPPPELAGRKHILEDAEVAIQRALLGKPFRSQILKRSEIKKEEEAR